MAESRTNEFESQTAEEKPEKVSRMTGDNEETSLWVFGYGSLCWHQGFEYEKSLTGFVEGFSRKFWQGNTTHRGTEKKPGRVATLVEDGEGIVWGQAFKVKDEKALPYLNNRECELGGYMTTIATFFPRRERRISQSSPKPFPVVLYVATPSNRLWLGDSPLPDIANQIVECTGGSGHNVEYLLRLAEFIRDKVPEAIDDHLFTLEFLVRSLIEERKLCLRTLMGESPISMLRKEENQAEVEEEEDDDDDGTGAGAAATTSPAPSFHFTELVTSKKLRCVNI